MLQIGSLVDGKYKILNKVGQGGMSVVYLAMNEKANKQWAVKEVRKDGIKDFEVVKQGLVAETDILKKLDHPNLPSIVDVIDTDDSFIIIMDYIQGNSLNKTLDEYGAQPQEQVIAWAKQLCDVLGYLHTRTPAIIYRDMKPANVMLKPDGNVTLIDFGTAREFKEKNLADTTCLGTIGYAAPEQFGGMGQTDARTDIYCLGATLYHLVTGMNPCEPPYEIKPIREINPSLSGGLEKIILKCTQRDPNDRYQSAAELMYALEHYEEIDDLYRKKQKKKLYKFIFCAFLTVVFAATSAWGYIAAENKKSENYDYILAKAESYSNHSDVVSKYLEAIATDPTRTEAFLGNGIAKGLIQYLIDDSELSSDDHATFNQLNAGIDHENSWGYMDTIKPLDELKAENFSGYQEVCYCIGEAYIYYYFPKSEGNDDARLSVKKAKYNNAAIWFRYAGDDRQDARIYCEISDCLKNIEKFSKAEKSDDLSAAYKELWVKLKQLYDNAKDFDTDLKFRVCKEVVDIIDINKVGLMQVCNDAPDMDVAQIVSILESIKNDNAKITNGLMMDRVSELNGQIDLLKASILSGKTGKSVD